MGKRLSFRSLIAALTSLTVTATTWGQSLPVDDVVYNDYARVLQLAGSLDRSLSFSARPITSYCLQDDAVHPWSGLIECKEPSDEERFQYAFVSPEADVFFNSDRPFGQNDGPVWQGNGPTAAFSTGLWGKAWFLSAMLRPEVIYTWNADFDLSQLPLAQDQSVYAYPYRNNIDWPQRFGDDPWTDLVLDGSYLQVEYRTVAGGISKQNLWWGPGIRNSIVMSNNAGGFWHAFLRSNDRIETPIGSLEGRWIWGHLSHSEYFVDASYSPERVNRHSEEEDRFITAITLNWNPEWVPGLYVGAAQSVMMHSGLKKRLMRDYLGVVNIPFFSSDATRPRGMDDKLFSMFGRWVHSNSGVEVYAEWARGDHTSDLRDVFVEPDHARGWLLGLQKVFKPSRQVWTRFLVEFANLEKTRESGHRVDRGSYFYAHSSLRQGYTHNGQIIGAGIGPGSNSQFLRADVLAPFGRVGVHLLRWAHDNDRYFIYELEPGESGWNYEVELGGGLSGLIFWNGFEVEGSLTYTKIMNMDHISRNDVPNWNASLSIRRQLMGIR